MTMRLLSTTAILLGAALTGVAAQETPEERLVAHLKDHLGGRVERDETRPGRPVVKIDLSWPIDYVIDITPFHPAKNEDLKDVATLTQLQKLDLSWTDVTNVGLKNLTRLRLRPTSLATMDDGHSG